MRKLFRTLLDFAYFLGWVCLHLARVLAFVCLGLAWICAFMGLIAYLASLELTNWLISDVRWVGCVCLFFWGKFALLGFSDLVVRARAPRPSTRAIRKCLDALRRGREPYALYLRNHSIEKGTAYGNSGNPADPVGLRYYLDLSNQLENSIVRSVAIPVFALIHPEEEVIGAALRIAVPREGWREEVERLIDGAALIIVTVAELTSAIDFELGLLRSAGAGDRTVVIATDRLHTELDARHPELARSVRWRARVSTGLRKQNVTLPPTLLSRWGHKSLSSAH